MGSYNRDNNRGILRPDGVNPAVNETMDLYDKAAQSTGTSVSNTRSYFEQMHETMTAGDSHELIDYTTDGSNAEMAEHSLGGKTVRDVSKSNKAIEPGNNRLQLHGTQAHYQHKETGEIRSVTHDPDGDWKNKNPHGVRHTTYDPDKLNVTRHDNGTTTLHSDGGASNYEIEGSRRQSQLSSSAKEYQSRKPSRSRGRISSLDPDDAANHRAAAPTPSAPAGNNLPDILKPNEKRAKATKLVEDQDNHKREKRAKIKEELNKLSDDGKMPGYREQYEQLEKNTLDHTAEIESRKTLFTPEVSDELSDEMLAVQRETARAFFAGDTEVEKAGVEKAKEIKEHARVRYSSKVEPRQSQDWSKLTVEERDAAYKQAYDDSQLGALYAAEKPTGNSKVASEHLYSAYEQVSDRSGKGVGLSPEEYEKERQRIFANNPDHGGMAPTFEQQFAGEPDPTTPQPAATSQPAAAPEKTLNRAQKKALEAQQKRAAAAAQATAAPPSAVESAVESASENAPETRPQAATEEPTRAAAQGPSSKSEPVFRFNTPEEDLDDADSFAEFTSRRPEWDTADIDQRSAMMDEAVQYQKEVYSARGQKHPLDFTPDEHLAVRRHRESLNESGSRSSPASEEKPRSLEVRRMTQEEVDQTNENYRSRTINHPDWESATDGQKLSMGTQAALSEIDDYEARGQQHPMLHTDDDWNELHGKEDEATRAHYAYDDEYMRSQSTNAQDALRARQTRRDYEEQARNQPSASAVDDVLDPGFDDGGSSQRTAGSAAEAVDDASTAAPGGSTAAPKAGATASKGAKITTGAEAARTGANGMRTGSNSIASKALGGRGRRFNMDIVDRQLDLTTRGLAGSISSVINDYGLNRREAVGGGHMDTLFGKAIRTGGQRVSWSSAEYAAPVFNAAEKEAKWATFATAEEAAESWADEIEGRGAQGGYRNRARAAIYRGLGGRGSAANNMMAKIGGFGTALPVAFNLAAVGFGMKDGYREGGVGGAMKGGAKSLVGNAVQGQVIGASLAHPLLMLGGASLMMASYKVGHGIFDVRTKGNNYLKMGRAGGLSWNTGSTPGMDSQVASTMRGRALMSMENSRFNAMKSLGNESYMMTSPSARYANSTQLGSQSPMLAY